MSVEEAHRTVERRLARRTSHLLEWARRLEDPDRRRAFHAAYYSLRVAGPKTLPRPLGRSRNLEEFFAASRAWSDVARLCSQGQPEPGDAFQVALADAMRRFRIPMQPWLDLEEGMTDLARGEPVPDLTVFLARARRLARAPSSVFFRILCSRRGVRRYHLPRDVDVEELAHDPAAFAYLVGLMVDVFREVELRSPDHTSLPRELLERRGIRPEDLLTWRTRPTAPRRFVLLMQDLAQFAWNFYESGVATFTQAAASLSTEAIGQIDGFLARYRAALESLERERFAPVRFEDVARGLEPHAAGHPGVSPE